MSDSESLENLKRLIVPGSCLLGLDPGSKRIGIALSDPTLRIATPLLILNRTKFSEDSRRLAGIVAERNVSGLIVGLPLGMSGNEGRASQSARAFARNLRAALNLPLAFWDERLSSEAVRRPMAQENPSRAKREDRIDSAAATFILQGALDRLASL